MFAGFLIIWVILNGRLTPEVVLVGLVLCAPLAIFCKAFLGYSFRAELRAFRRIPWAIRYLVLLLTEIIKANFAVMRLILSNRYEPEPVLFTFRTKLASEAARVLLANSITLTPGTITVKLTGDRYVVHALDRDISVGTEKSILQTMLYEAEGLTKETPDASKGSGDAEGSGV